MHAACTLLGARSFAVFSRQASNGTGQLRSALPTSKLQHTIRYVSMIMQTHTSHHPSPACSPSLALLPHSLHVQADLLIACMISKMLNHMRVIRELGQPTLFCILQIIQLFSVGYKPVDNDSRIRGYVKLNTKARSTKYNMLVTSSRSICSRLRFHAYLTVIQCIIRLISMYL
jgi:hypothetical protein